MKTAKPPTTSDPSLADLLSRSKRLMQASFLLTAGAPSGPRDPLGSMKATARVAGELDDIQLQMTKAGLPEPVASMIIDLGCMLIGAVASLNAPRRSFLLVLQSRIAQLTMVQPT